MYSSVGYKDVEIMFWGQGLECIAVLATRMVKLCSRVRA